MRNTKSTRRSLYSSLVSLVLCVAMLVGSTFAWFTDVVTTGKNTIATGNLDVGLKYSMDFETWKDVDSSTVLFSPDTKWEPGHVEVVYLEVANKGELAFYYRVGTNLITNQLGKNQENGEIDLTEIIEFAIIPVEAKLETRDSALALAEGEAIGFSNYFIAEESLDKNGETAKYAMVVWMPEDAGDAYNHNGTDKPALEFGIKVIASQKPYEKDSFGDDYDTDSTYPDYGFVTYEPEEDIVIEGDGFVATIPAEATLETADGTELSSGDELVMYVSLADAAPSSLTIAAGSVVIPYTISLETKSGEEVTATEGVITVELNIGAGRTGTIELYHYAEKVEGASYNAETGILSFATNDFSPFTVVAVGVLTSDTDWYNESDTEFIITTADELFGLATLVNGSGISFDGKTIKLGADIDLQNAEWNRIGTDDNHFKGDFDGQGYTISNLSINAPDGSRRGLFGNTGGNTTIRNLTIHNATVNAYQSASVLVGRSRETLNVSNVKITGDVQVTASMTHAATIVAWGGIGSISDVTVDVNEGSYVKDTYAGDAYYGYDGGIWGQCWPTSAKNITSNIDVYTMHTATGGIGGGCAAVSENITCTGDVIIATKTDTTSKQNRVGGYYDWQTNGLIYGFGVNTSNKSTNTNCVATGTLTIGGEVITDYGFVTDTNGYVVNDVRFGAPYYAAGVIIIEDSTQSETD